MHLDKHQDKALSWMFDEHYRPVLRRTIALLILGDIADIFASVQATYSQLKAAHRGELSNHKMEILHSDRCKVALMDKLENVHAKKRGDVIDEMLKQYGLTVKDEIDTWHQKLEPIFDDEILTFKSLLANNAYGMIYELSKFNQEAPPSQ